MPIIRIFEATLLLKIGLTTSFPVSFAVYKSFSRIEPMDRLEVVFRAMRQLPYRKCKQM